MKILIFYMLFRCIGTSSIYAASGLILIDKGFPQEDLSSLQLLNLPFITIISLLVGKYLKRGTESLHMYIGFWLTMVDSMFLFLIVTYYEAFGSYNNFTLTAIVIL